jgi:hypothetical protein
MNTIQLAINSTTDVDPTGRNIVFYGADTTVPPINFLNTLSTVKTVYSAEVPAVLSVAFTEAASTTYSFIVRQVQGSFTAAIPVSYTTNATQSGDDLEDALVAILTKLRASGALKIDAVTSNDASPLVITAAAGYPLLTISDVHNTTTTVTTAGAKAVNAGADLVAAGVPNAVSGNTYTSFEMLTASLAVGAGQERNIWKKVVYYIKTGDTAIAKLTTALNAAIYDPGNFTALS